MAERRVVNTAARSASGAARSMSTPPSAETSAPDSGKKRNKLLIAIILLLTLVVVGGGAFVVLTVLGDDAGQTGETIVVERSPEPGDVVPVTSVSVNLAGGHYLRLAFSLQLTADSEGVEEARVQDIAIDLFSGREMSEINTEESRNELKATLVERLSEAFDGEVLDVYLTDFVTQ